MQTNLSLIDSWLTSLDGMLTTPVDRRFSLNFLFSICPFPFLELGPLFFFSLPLPGDVLSLSLSLETAVGLESWEAQGTFSGGGVFFKLLPWLSAPLGAGVVGCGSSSGLFKAEDDDERAIGEDVRQLTGTEPPRSMLALLFSSVLWAALRVSLLLLLPVPRDGVASTLPAHAPVAAAMSTSIFALIFSRLAFHSSKKSVGADLNPPVAMILFLHVCSHQWGSPGKVVFVFWFNSTQFSIVAYPTPPLDRWEQLRLNWINAEC